MFKISRDSKNINTTELSLKDIGFNEFHDVIEDYESFISVVAHDFSASIRHIKEFSSLLKRSMTNVCDDQGLYFSYIEKSLIRLDCMQIALQKINDINTTKYKKSDISMQETLRNVTKKIDFSQYQSNLVVSCEPLPVVHAVPKMMEDLMFHLIDNACRFCPDNGKQKVFISAFERGNDIIFEVKDNGIGIDNDFTSAVFNIFRRLHKQDDYGGGVGAGLTIAKRIIEYHGGNIWIKSKLDIGTSILFSIPNKKD